MDLHKASLLGEFKALVYSMRKRGSDWTFAEGPLSKVITEQFLHITQGTTIFGRNISNDSTVFWSPLATIFYF